MYLKRDSNGKAVKVCDEFTGDTMFEYKNILIQLCNTNYKLNRSRNK